MKNQIISPSKKASAAGKRVENREAQLTRELRERTKELNCVYAISKICENPDASIEDVLQRIVELLPASWQYADLAGARLTLQGSGFRTANFTRTRYLQSSRIFVCGGAAGVLEVCYLRNPVCGNSSPFLKAEQKLLDMVAERLGRIVELKDAERELKAAHERLRCLLRSVEKARETERKRIAHELHDELGHALMALKIDLGLLRDGCPGMTVVSEKTRSMSESIDATIRNLQRIAWELKPVLLEEFGLPAAISTLGDEFEKRSGIRCLVRVCAGFGGFDKELSLALYRITQELLTNVAKHAMASKVTINLKKTKDGLVLSVKDNGKGIKQEALLGKKTLGLLGIRERVHSCGGILRIHGQPDHGTSMTITIPFSGLGERK